MMLQSYSFSYGEYVKKLLTVEDEIRVKVLEQERAEGRAEGIVIGENKGRTEGIAIGEQRSQRTIYERLITSGGMTPQQASIMTGWNG